MARRAAPRRRFTVTIITNVDTRTVAAGAVAVSPLKRNDVHVFAVRMSCAVKKPSSWYRTPPAQVCGENQQSAINKPILHDSPRSQCVHDGRKVRVAVWVYQLVTEVGAAPGRQ